MVLAACIFLIAIPFLFFLGLHKNIVHAWFYALAHDRDEHQRIVY